MKLDVMVVSYSKCTLENIDGFLHRFVLQDKKLTIKDSYPMDRGMYTALYSDKLFALYRKPFIGSFESGFSAFRIRNGVNLRSSSEVISTQGEVACHISVDSEKVFAANYVSGSVCKADWKDDGKEVYYSNFKIVKHRGQGTSMPRQDAPHCHFAQVQGEWVYVVDLGLDTVFVYDRELNYKSSAKVPLGYGARHLAFSNDGKYAYCVNELVSSISVFALDGEKITYLNTVMCPLSTDKENTGAAIRLTGNLIIISNRGDDTLCSFEVEGEKLTFKQCISCGGKSPRDFNITPDGKLLICANEKTNNLTIFDIENNNLTYVSEVRKIKNPLCVMFIEDEN